MLLAICGKVTMEKLEGRLIDGEKTPDEKKLQTMLMRYETSNPDFLRVSGYLRSHLAVTSNIVHGRRVLPGCFKMWSVSHWVLREKMI